MIVGILFLSVLFGGVAAVGSVMAGHSLLMAAAIYMGVGSAGTLLIALAVALPALASRGPEPAMRGMAAARD